MKRLKEIQIKLSIVRKLTLDIINSNTNITYKLEKLKNEIFHDVNRFSDMTIFNFDLDSDYPITSRINKNYIINKDIAIEVNEYAVILKASSIENLGKINFITEDKRKLNLKEFVSLAEFSYNTDTKWHNDYKKSFTIKDIFQNYIMYILITNRNQYVIMLFIKNNLEWKFRQFSILDYLFIATPKLISDNRE